MLCCFKSAAIHSTSGPHLLDLKAGLVDMMDYYVLPERAYQMLREWHQGDGPHFERSVISVGTGANAVDSVDLYPLVVKVAYAGGHMGAPDVATATTHLFSRYVV
jgi:hypothetical protein